ncbi:hypothetical protein [Aestuariivirga sp.]|uniref:hypothetical protein n=1 Tax=Aestuariivirga sp. TaxID=2650926 RepID=UPI0025C3A2AD|nr:hypothetical protein [Aestuariivirga sp.]
MARSRVDIRARIYDMQHEAATQSVMTYEENGERFPIGPRLPFEAKDWEDKRRAVDKVMILDNVLIPWEDVLFYQHTRAGAFIRQTLHRYSAFPFVQRTLSYADLIIGAALWNARQIPRNAAA